MMTVLERALFAVGGILICGGWVAVYAHERSLATATHERAATTMLMKFFVVRPAEAAGSGDCLAASWDHLLSPVPAMHWPVPGDTGHCARMARN